MFWYLWHLVYYICYWLLEFNKPFEIVVYNHAFEFFPKPIHFQNIQKFTPGNKIVSATKIHLFEKPNNLVNYSKKFIKQLAFFYDVSKLRHMEDWLYSTKTTILKLNNMYGTDIGTWAYDNTSIYLAKSSYRISYFPFHFNLREGNIRYIVDKMLLIGHKRCQNNYAHLFADKLVALMLIPQEVRAQCYVIGNSYFPIVNEALISIGFKPYQILNFNFGEWFYAKELYVMTDYRPMNSFAGPPVEKLRKQIFDYFSLDLIKAQNYGLVNRKSTTRNIKNFDELFHSIIKEFPNVHWQNIPDDAGNMNQTAYLWTSLKLALAMTGSTCSKGIFMKPNTVLCIPTCELLDYTIMNLLVGSKHAIYLFPTGFKHLPVGSFNIDIEESLNALRNCLFYDQHQNWMKTN